MNEVEPLILLEYVVPIGTNKHHWYQLERNETDTNILLLLLLLLLSSRTRYVIGLASGDVEWSYATGDIIKCSPAIVGEHVWFGSYDKRLYVLDIAARRCLLSKDIGGSMFATPTANATNTANTSRGNEELTVYVATTACVVAAIVGGGPSGHHGANGYNGHTGLKKGLNGSLGDTRWSTTLPAPVFSSPVYCDEEGQDLLVVGCADGVVYGLGGGDGGKQWCYVTAGPIFSSPVYYGRDGGRGQGPSFLFGSHDGCVHQIDGQGRGCGTLVVSRAGVGTASQSGATGSRGCREGAGGEGGRGGTGCKGGEGGRGSTSGKAGGEVRTGDRSEMEEEAPSPVFASPFVAQSAAGAVCCIASTDGTVIIASLGQVREGGAANGGGGGHDGELSPPRGGLSCLFRTKLPGAVFSSPVMVGMVGDVGGDVAAVRVFVGCRNDLLYCLAPRL